MKNFFYSFLFFFSFNAAIAQDTTKILFIGNSFTYYNAMPQMVKAFADSAHLRVSIGMHAPGGISVGDTAQGNMAHMNNPALFSLIRSKKWDVVVLQDNQGRFLRDSAVFSPASKVIQGHLNIMDSVKVNNSCAKMVLFGGWAFKNGSPPFGNTGIELIRNILVNYRVLNDTMKEVIAPIGEAWIKAINYLPAVNLWDADEAHPSYPGSFLTASAIFSTIFNLPAKALNYSGTLPPATAYNLCAFGDSAVFGTMFHTKYNLGGIKKEVPEFQNGHLWVPGNYAAYTWYKNKVFVGNAPTLLYSGNADYMAVLTENDGCQIKTCLFSGSSVTGIGEAELLKDICIYPNPVSGGTFIIKQGTFIKDIKLVNLSGATEAISIVQLGAELNISAAGLKPGCYVLQLTTHTNALLHKKLIVAE